MQAKSAQILNELGVTHWQLRGKITAEPSIVTASEERVIAKPQAALPTWDELKDRVQTCTQCALHKTRRHAVFGVGDKNADLVIVGEAPGANEDKQGEPFVGRAGQLLNRMLQSVGMERSDVFILNVLKCRPPNNRDPSSEEIAACTIHLEQQLAMLKPRALLAVGRVAAHYLLGIDERLARMRTQVWQFGENKIPLHVTYHPAYLLRNPRDKGKAFIDLQRAVNTISQ